MFATCVEVSIIIFCVHFQGRQRKAEEILVTVKDEEYSKDPRYENKIPKRPLVEMDP